MDRYFGPLSGTGALFSAQRATGGGRGAERRDLFFQRQCRSCSRSTMGLFQLGCLAWIHLALALTASGLSRTELFDYGVQHGDQILPPGPDQTQELALDQTLFFFKGSFDTVYINTNGFIAMDDVPEETVYLGQMPASFGMVAALLGDLDTSDGVGRVYYRQDSSPAVLLRATEHISQAFPADDEVEPTHVIIVTWENVSPQGGASGRGDGAASGEGNTFQLVIASMESASYAILLYPRDGLRYLSTPIGDDSRPLEVGFNQGQVTGWLWSSTGEYYRVSSDDEGSIRELTKKTNSGQRGVWVYEIGTSPFFTSIHSGETEELDFEESTTAAPSTTVPLPVIPEREREPEREEGPQYPPVHPPYETVTDDYEVVDEGEETPVPPTQAPRPPVDPGQFPVYPRPTYPQPSYPEPHYPEPAQPDHRRPQPERPQVVVVDTDDLDVDVFSYNYETCANNWQKCSSFADCRDYSSGYCCHCRPGYYGDGRDCVAEGKPQRMNGKVTGRVFVGGSSSPLEFASNELHSYVVANDGRAYVAISTIPSALGPSLQPLASLGGAIGWAFALEQPGYQNGFSLIGGRFTRQAEVTFHPGNERLTITQVFKGIDEHDHLTISTSLEGRLPEVPYAATVQIEPYKEVYQYSRNIITSSSRREYTVSLAEGGIQTLSYSWRQTITFEGCHHDQAANQPPSSQQLSVDQVFVMYDSANQLIRYAMSNKIGSIHSEGVENPCFTGRHGCDTNAMCRPGEGTHFTCECATGFTGDGRACYDVDECRETPHICGHHAVCSNQPGTFRCECMDGYQFASDGRTCVEVERPVNHCVRGTHDCDLAERAQCSYTGGSAYICSCLPGYQGDGRSCRDIDECQPGRCHGDAICYNTQGSFTCQCRPGFYGDGFHCTPDSHREKTACEQHRERALAASANTGGYFFFRPRPAVGQFVPTCDPYGAYEPMQCHGSTGQCWCVDREGQEITGTRTGPDSKPSCIDQGVAPTPVGPTPRPDVSPLAPGTSLLFAQSGKIEHLPLNGETMLKEEAKTLLHVPDKVVIALAYDCVDKAVYWSDITQPAISRVPLKGGQPTTLIKTDLGSPEGIAIDHLSRLMYWTDSMMDRIEVSKLDGSHRRVLFDDNLVNPRPIVADPINGRLYWSDWNRDGPKVEMSNMDGTDRSVLVSEDLGLPNGLTFDPQTRQLCWADAGTRKVECVDPYTHQRRKIVEGIQYPFAVVHYGSNLYYTDWRREAVVAVDRRAEKEVDAYLPLRRSRTYGITTTHPQCLPGVNYCSGSNGGCSHLCLPRPGGLTCRCPDANDGTCVERERQ